ncbi:MAG: IS1182 family transposase [Planctomycetota bacterium]
MKNTYWARTPLPREQVVLFAKRLDEVISDDHPARVYAEILEGYDWSAWEASYHGHQGQPPIHPRILAGLWLYGVRRGIRSTRKMEYMTGHNLDFMWLAEGHTPDHTTFSKFRTKFKEPLKDLYRHVVKVALTAGLARLAGVASDGTHIKASASRFETWTQKKIEAVLEQLEAEFTARLEEVSTTNSPADDALPEPGSGQLFEELGGDSEPVLPPELQEKQARLESLRGIQQQLQEADAARSKAGKDPETNPAQIPMTDPASRVMPNKDGGFAPNYTPIATTESHGGFIVDIDVTNDVSDSNTLLPSVDRIKEDHGEYPGEALADGAYASGRNISGMESREIEFLSNMGSTAPETNPAVRDDPTQPVADALWIALPLAPQTKKLDRCCFLYNESDDCYYCPMGQRLTYSETKRDTRRGRRRERRVYRCQQCADCPHRPQCVSERNKSGRTVSRDVHTPERERLAAKMRDPSNQKKYDQRMRIAETPFGLIKEVLGLRQFLLRGLEKVQTEWRWACLAVNLDKLVRGIQRLREAFQESATSEA